MITVDLIVGLPESQGFDAIFVTADRLGKRLHIAPTTTEVDSVGIARLFRDNVWRHHGLPKQIISDCGTQFVSQFTRELNRLLGIQTTPSTAFHPQTDGQTERINQEIEQYLRVFINHRQDDWAEWLPLAEFAYNNRIHSSTRKTPFEVEYGRHPRLGIEPDIIVKNEAADQFTQRMKKVIEETRSALKQAADDMARHYNAHRAKDATRTVFAKGDLVWLDARNLKSKRPMKKLDDKWYGPFVIEEVLPKNAYRLQLTFTFRHVHPVFNVSLLRRYTPDSISERPQYDHPPPELDEQGEVAYEVEEILDSRFIRSKLQYLIRWKGYGPEWNSWEPEENVRNSPRLITKFHREHPNAPRRISAIDWQQFPFQRLENLTETPRLLFDWTNGKLVGSPSPKRGVMSGE